MQMDTDPNMEALVRYLYNEGPDPGIKTDPALAQEFAALSSVKAALDAQPAVRPEPATLAAVFATAETKPHARIFTLHRLRPLAAAAVVVIAFGMGLWMIQQPDATLDAPARAAEAGPAPMASESFTVVPEREEEAKDALTLKEEADGFAERRRAMRNETASAVSTPAAPALGLASAGDADALAKTSEAVPRWDDDAELRALYWRVNALKLRSENMQWDEPIPLEQIPLDAGGRNRPLRVDMKR